MKLLKPFAITFIGYSKDRRKKEENGLGLCVGLCTNVASAKKKTKTKKEKEKLARIGRH